MLRSEIVSFSFFYNGDLKSMQGRNCGQCRRAGAPAVGEQVLVCMYQLDLVYKDILMPIKSVSTSSSSLGFGCPMDAMPLFDWSL